MRWLWLLFLLALGCILWLDRPSATLSESQQLMLMLQQSADRLPAEMLRHNRAGVLTMQTTGETISEMDIAAALLDNKDDQARPFMWQDQNGRPAIISAQGIDTEHHFANSYLVGAHPFRIDNPALPLHFLAKRKVYQYDQQQYQRGDVWQNSAQAWVHLRGDCEDHAMILADWLLAEGFDARVVLGSYRGEGHAWVVAFLQGQVYLLEATDKQAGKSWQHLPLAALASDYHAEFMFNRDKFWVRKAQAPQPDYQSAQWLETAQFRTPDPE